MRLASYYDRAIVIEIITQSFRDNPTLNYCIRKWGRKSRHIRAIAEYAFDFAIKRNGVFISSDNKAVGICYHARQSKQSLHDFWLMLKMICKSFALQRLLKMIQHDRFVKKQRPAHDEYYYFWFFGALPSSNRPNSAVDIKNSIFKLAELINTDIYAETTIERNKRVYQRYGFEVYKKWTNNETGITVWFMRKFLSHKVVIV